MSRQSRYCSTLPQGQFYFKVKVKQSIQCHARSNELDYLRRAELADQYQAPIGNENLVKANLEDKSRRTARSAGNALLKNYEKIPEKRRIELENTLAQYFNVDFSQELIQLASDLPVTVKGMNHSMTHNE